MACKTFCLILVNIFMMVAQAAVITFNTNAAGGHGFYSGTGGVDGGFTTVTDTGVQLSVRAAQRYVGPITPTGNNYICASGMQCNVDWSIEANPLSNFVYSLRIESVTNGGSVTFDPTHPLLGGSYWNPTLPGEVMVAGPNNTGNQNSEFFGFSFIATPLGGWAPTDELKVRLSATPIGGGDTTFVDITVNGGTTVPEPGTWALIGLGLAGLAFIRRH